MVFQMESHNTSSLIKESLECVPDLWTPNLSCCVFVYQDNCYRRISPSQYIYRRLDTYNICRRANCCALLDIHGWVKLHFSYKFTDIYTIEKNLDFLMTAIIEEVLSPSFLLW